MGATVDVDVTGGFSGTVTGYIPVTADAAIVTASAHKPGHGATRRCRRGALPRCASWP